MQIMKTAPVQDKLSVILDETQKIIDNSNSFLLLYDKCRNDELLFDVSFLEFSASFSEFNTPTASLSFLSFIDISQCIPNPYMSEFSGNVLFTSSTAGITATINICFSEMFSDPERAFEIFKKYDFLEGDSVYTRRLDGNCKVGEIEVSGQAHFNFSLMSKISSVEDMVTLCKATFREMNKYLCDKEWTELECEAES